jgi:hypothetical protein
MNPGFRDSDARHAAHLATALLTLILPEDAEVPLGQGRVLAAMGKREEAVAAFENRSALLLEKG